ncbi:hypothetical protein [Nitrosomonas sp.]|uniref:hypothetical protein n=1 Tax=Nitrosomonas sp. TaxID=42353 RepID=UPI001D2360D9|nr:hypothetical protein [Nitrosomonas sp.]MCB1949037.1 hypothetical protein [Nitrosomonas sp.]MCP5244333.1 hypothetical protein [Burkholderiales bacterium]MCP5291648.1 hypothetical protein [Burkholderiales bacterium]MDR4514503.1 hypothetical protein [Nitrosomonas sp.]
MNEEQRRIIIKRITSYEQQGDNAEDRAPLPPINRWVALAIMIPVLAVLAVLGVFFFTIFVALFSIIAIIFGVRIWWLRKKFQRSMHQANDSRAEKSTHNEQSSDSGTVEDAEIIEETTIIKEHRQSGTGDKHNRV